MSQFVQLFERIVRDEEGQDLVEYGMLVALIALIAVGGVTFFGEEVEAFFRDIGSRIPFDGGGGGG